MRHDASMLAGLDILDLEVARVGDRVDPIDGLRRAATAVSANRPRSLTLLWTCCSAISLCLGRSECCSRTDPGLGVHRPAVRIRQRELALATRSQCVSMFLKPLTPPSQRCSTSPPPVPPSSCPSASSSRSRDNLRRSRPNVQLRLPAVHCLDPCTVQLASEQLQFAAPHELPKHLSEGRPIDPPETIVLKSDKRRNSQITSRLRLLSASSRRLERTRLR